MCVRCEVVYELTVCYVLLRGVIVVCGCSLYDMYVCGARMYVMYVRL